MKKSTFRIGKMDCMAEEQLVRMKLEGVDSIRSMDFDIPGRTMVVYHEGSADRILINLETLNLDSSIIATEPVTGKSENAQKHEMERKLLWQVLLINLFFFGLEVATGFIANSMGLVADGMDMLADSIVYGLALFAVGGTLVRKKRISGLMGIFQLILTILGFAEVIRRFIFFEQVPSFAMMIIISILALTGNILSLYLLQKSRSEEVHLKASTICTSNDVIVNFGVIIAGVLVLLTQSKYPDLIIGLIVFTLVGIGSFRILKLSM